MMKEKNNYKERVEKYLDQKTTIYVGHPPVRLMDTTRRTVVRAIAGFGIIYAIGTGVVSACHHSERSIGSVPTPSMAVRK